MAPLDWTSIMAADIDQLNEDDDAVDRFFADLKDFTIEKDHNDVEKLQQLFLVTQMVMKAKGLEAEMAVKEMEEMAFSHGKKIKELSKQIEDQQQQITVYQEGVAGPSSGGGPADTKLIVNQVRELKQQNEDYVRELKEKERDLVYEKKELEKYMERNKELENDKRDLHSRLLQLEDEIKDYREQIQTPVTEEDNEKDRVKEKMIKEKNKQIHELIADLDVYEEQNSKLSSQVSELKEKLKDAVDQMDKTTSDYLKLKEIVDRSDEIIDNLRKQNEILNSELNEFKDKGDKSTDSDDEIMMALNVRVEEWKSLLAEKDNEIINYQAVVEELQDKITSISVDANKTSVAMLTKAVEERDQEIDMLKQQLEGAAKDMENNIEMINKLKEEMFSGDDGGMIFQKHIDELQKELRESNVKLRHAEERMAEAENDARKRDKELAEVHCKMRQYELGEYGLADAVAEIKDCKSQLRVRDRQIEQLTQHSNRNELQLYELIEENDEQRTKLGLEPRSPTAWNIASSTEDVKVMGHGATTHYATNIQKLKALNRILQQEIEKLEEERIELKIKLRKLAQVAGQRAVSAGLSSNELQSIQDLTKSLKPNENIKNVLESITGAEHKDHKFDIKEMKSYLQECNKIRDELKTENVDLKRRNDDLEDVNKKLEQGMKEILTSLKEQNNQQDVNVKCPTLEQLLKVIESGWSGSRSDSSSYIKTQLDLVQGKCDQLRCELKSCRQENNQLLSQLERHKIRNENLEDRLKLIVEDQSTSKPADQHPVVQLPSLSHQVVLTKNNSDLIASLNSHLIHVLHELSDEREVVSKLEEEMEKYKRKFVVYRHQQGLLYQRYNEEKKCWSERENNWKDEKEKYENSRRSDAVKIGEFDRLLDTLEQDEVELKRRLGDATRKLTVLKVNEESLSRKCDLLNETKRNLEKRNKNNVNEIVKIENNVTQRIGALKRYKEMAVFRITALEKALENSVPCVELHKANREYEELTVKYRDLLEKDNCLVMRTEVSQQNEIEVQRLEKEKKYLRNELETQKEIIHNMEAALESLKNQGISPSVDANTIEPLSKRLATIEMKELNERQRADHSQMLYEQQKTILQNLEQRNDELEIKFKELTKINLCQQRVERELRDQLSRCVSIEVNNSNEKKILELRKTEVESKQEISKLKEMADIACNQVDAVETTNKSQRRELDALNHQLTEFQSQSDERALIGKLYRQVLMLQLSEGLATSKVEKMMANIAKTEATCIKLEQLSEEKEQQIYLTRRQAANKFNFLNKLIHELRRQYSGTIPISKQEKFTMEMIKLQEDRNNAQKSLQDAKERQLQAEDKLAEYELKLKGLEELMETLKSNNAAQRVSGWHSKLEGLRLSDMKNKRHVDRLEKQIEHLENVIKEQEKKLDEAEIQIIRHAKDIEERELYWENRESDLEVMMTRTEKRDDDVRAEQSPIRKSLDRIVKDPVDGSNQIIVAELNRKLVECDRKVRDLNGLLRDKDRQLHRLRVGASDLLSTELKNDEDIYEPNVGAIANATVETLKKLLAQKEESLQKYEELLKKSNADYEEQNRRHQAELESLHEQLKFKRESHLNNFREVIKEMTDVLNKNDGVKTGLSNKQLARLNELEDIVSEQENAMSGLADKLHESRSDVNVWKQKVDEITRTMEQEVTRLKDKHASELTAVEKAALSKDEEIAVKVHEIEALQKESETHTAITTQAPNNTLKAMVERLKRQLTGKEQQLRSLSRALTELRSDMVNVAQQNVIAQQSEAKQVGNVQNLVDRKTHELRTKVDKLESEVVALKTNLKKSKDVLNELNDEIFTLKERYSKSESNYERVRKERDEFHSRADKAKSSVHKGEQSGSESNEEVVALKNQIVILEDRLYRQQIQPAEKPYDSQQDFSKEVKTQEERIKWDVNKKWQKSVDRLKTIVKQKEEELESLRKQIKLTRDQLTRTEREKSTLENKLKVATRATSATNKSNASTPDLLQEMKKKNLELEERISNLQRDVGLGKDKLFEELKMKNSFLEEKLQNVQRQLTRYSLGKKVPADVSDEVRSLESKLDKSQKEIIKKSETNLELKFELEQCKLEIPRLRHRIDDLENYVQTMKRERRTSSSGSASNATRKAEENMRTVEDLESTIGAMTKVIENLQKEKEMCKVTLMAKNNLVDGLNDKIVKITDESDELRAKLEEKVDGSNFDGDGSGRKVRKSIAIRIQDDKIRKLEAELKKKKVLLDNLKSFPTQLTEQRLVQEKHTSSSCAKCDSLMEENRELKVELENLRAHVERHKSDSSKVRKKHPKKQL